MRKLLIDYHHVQQNMSTSNHTFDFATLSVFTLIMLLSLCSIFYIFHLRFKSYSSHHLKSFNSLWTIRLLLVLFVSGWAVNEFLFLPFIRNVLNFSKQTNLVCKLHVVLSLGFLQPGFLVTLLYLVNVSTKQRNHGEKWSLFFIIAMTLPTLFLQIMFLFYDPFGEQLPLDMRRSSLLSVDRFGNSRIICTYPLISSIIFCEFAIVYSLGLSLACWLVGSLVINKTLRMRINILGVTVIMALLFQTLFLGAESLWIPHEISVGMVSFGVFLSVAVCGAVGEIVLVIKPVMEALETSGNCFGQLKNPNASLWQVSEGKEIST